MNIIERIKDISTNINTETISLPKSMKLELCSICNHKCNYCIVPTLKVSTPFMAVDTFVCCLNEAKKHSIKELGFFHMGESTLHPQFNDLVDLAYKDFDIFITSNGTKLSQLKYLVERQAKSIKISLNGYNKDVHYSVTGINNFDIIIDNIKKLVDFRNKIGSRTQISASSIYYNCEEQNEFCKFISSIVDNYFYTQIYNHAGKVNNKYIELSNNSNIIKHLNEIPCYGIYNLLHIKTDGSINMCRWGVDNEFTIGNIFDGIEKAWFSDKANTIRKLHKCYKLDTCNRCTSKH